MGNVTVIPSKINLRGKALKDLKEKRKVAAYARVSTESEEQSTSYDAQIAHYTEKINENPDWEFVKVYADEGISGTSIKNRIGFQNMMKDALEGKIDLILTKSISRFARNVVDTLVAIRELKANKIEVFFEKENIKTLDATGELLITIMSSLAQEESRSLSENVKWGHRHRFQNGKFHLPYKVFLGYNSDADGNIVVDEEQAKIVRDIYKMFLEGLTFDGIKKALEEKGVLTPRQFNKWSVTTIHSILTNEKYKGDALLQKSYVEDFLTKKIKTNKGEIPQYYVKNSHEAIIPEDEWDQVQREIKRRFELKGSFSKNNAFGSKVFCGDCGGLYGVKTWHSNNPKYKRTLLQCNKKFSNGVENKCKTPHIYEEEFQRLFAEVYKDIKDNKKVVINTCKLVINELSNTNKIDNELFDLNSELEVVTTKINKMVELSAKELGAIDDFKLRYDSLCERYKEVSELIEEKNMLKVENLEKANAVKGFMSKIDEDYLCEWNYELFNAVVEKAVIKNNNEVEFHFYGGQVIIKTIILKGRYNKVLKY